MKLLLSLALLFSCTITNAQFSVSLSGRLGMDKMHPIISLDYATSRTARVGIYGYGGTLSNYKYKVPDCTVDGTKTTCTGTEFYMPYSDGFSGRPIQGKTTMQGWGVGLFYAKDLALNLNDNNKFYWMLEGQYTSVLDSYDITYLNGSDENNYKGSFSFSSVSVGCKFGYKHVINQLFFRANFGASYYYPTYPNADAHVWGYSYVTPFVGVEMELDVGIGFRFE